MEVLLVDNRKKEMMVTLWEEKALHFHEGLADLRGVASFVVITVLLAKQYSARLCKPGSTHLIAPTHQDV